MNTKMMKWGVVLSALAYGSAALASGGAPAWSSWYSEHPKSWYDDNSEIDYFNTGKTPAWATNESCSDSGAFSAVSYNIFHNVGFVTDFGDEMEQSLGEVTKCADVVLFQEAWDYDDMHEDGPKSDMAARGYNMITPSGYYCNDDIDIENDCSGLLAFYKSGSGVSLVKELGFDAFDNVPFPDSAKEKGVWGFILRKESKYYYVFDTHFTYGSAGHLEGNSGDDNSRISNMQESFNFISNTISANRAAYPPAAVVFGGDFNADFARSSGSRGRSLLSAAGAAAAFTDPYELNASFGAFETAGFTSNWVGSAVDQGPNGMAGGLSADYDTILLGDAAYYNTCGATDIQYSGWAPRWYSDGGQRIWAYYTHSDHYGRWIRFKPSC